jgi:hypothetical protein
MSVIIYPLIQYKKMSSRKMNGGAAYAPADVKMALSLLKKARPRQAYQRWK